MKKMLLSLSFLLFFSLCSFSQWSATLSFRPSIPIGGVNLEELVNVYEDGTREAQIVTLGAGLTGSLGLQYRLSETFSAGLDVGYYRSLLI